MNAWNPDFSNAVSAAVCCVLTAQSRPAPHKGPDFNRSRHTRVGKGRAPALWKPCKQPTLSWGQRLTEGNRMPEVTSRITSIRVSHVIRFSASLFRWQKRSVAHLPDGSRRSEESAPIRSPTTDLPVVVGAHRFCTSYGCAWSAKENQRMIEALMIFVRSRPEAVAAQECRCRTVAWLPSKQAARSPLRSCRRRISSKQPSGK